MKAVVVELKNDLAAVLSDDGCVTTVKNNNYEIGQMIQIHKAGIPFTRKLGMFAASAAAFIILSTGIWAYASPYAYVSVDVNPSIEFNINRFDRVIHVKAVNDDGEKILNEIPLDKLKNKSIKEALVRTINKITDAGYFDNGTEGGIVIAASCKNTEKANELVNELEQSARQTTKENGDNVEVEAFHVGLDRVEEAKKLGVTPGKLNLIEKLKKAAGDSESINTEEWLNKPVKDIMKATKDYEKESDSGSDENASEEGVQGKEDSSGSLMESNDTEQNTVKGNKKPEVNKSKADYADEDTYDAADSSSNGKETDQLGKNSSAHTDKASKSDKKKSQDTDATVNDMTDGDSSFNGNNSDVTEGNDTASKGNKANQQADSLAGAKKEADKDNNASSKADKSDTEKSNGNTKINDISKDISQKTDNKSEDKAAGNEKSSGSNEDKSKGNSVSKADSPIINNSSSIGNSSSVDNSSSIDNSARTDNSSGTTVSSDNKGSSNTGNSSNAGTSSGTDNNNGNDKAVNSAGNNPSGSDNSNKGNGKSKNN